MVIKKSSLISSAVLMSFMAASSHTTLAASKEAGTPSHKKTADASWIKNPAKTSAQIAAEKARAERDAELAAMRKGPKKETAAEEAANPSPAQPSAKKGSIAHGAGATSSGTHPHHFIKPNEEKKRFFVPKSGHHMGPKEHSGVQELTKGSAPHKVPAPTPAPVEHHATISEAPKPQQAVKLLAPAKVAELPTESSHQRLLDAAKAEADATSKMVKDPSAHETHQP